MQVLSLTARAQEELTKPKTRRWASDPTPKQIPSNGLRRVLAMEILPCHLCFVRRTRHSFQSGVDCKKAINLVRSSADASPPYGFMLLPGTTSSGFAMKLSSFPVSHTKSAPFIALE